MARGWQVHNILNFDYIDSRRTAGIRQAVEDGPIELASSVLVDTLESYVEVVLNALGHPEASVTDLNTIGDFGLEDDERCAASAKLGVALSDDDYVYEISRRLRDQA